MKQNLLNIQKIILLLYVTLVEPLVHQKEQFILMQMLLDYLLQLITVVQKLPVQIHILVIYLYIMLQKELVISIYFIMVEKLVFLMET